MRSTRASRGLAWAVLLVLGGQGALGLAELRAHAGEGYAAARSRALTTSLDQRLRALLGPLFEPYDLLRRTARPGQRVFVAYTAGTERTLDVHALRQLLHTLDIHLLPSRGQVPGGVRLDGTGGLPGPGDLLLDLGPNFPEDAFPDLEVLARGADHVLYRVRPELPR